MKGMTARGDHVQQDLNFPISHMQQMKPTNTLNVVEKASATIKPGPVNVTPDTVEETADI
jgi:hypothetical protein